MGSAVQRMAMQCWCLHFQPQDHSFLLQSNVFANISKALSGAEEGDSNNTEKKAKGNKVQCMLMRDGRKEERSKLGHINNAKQSNTTRPRQSQSRNCQFFCLTVCNFIQLIDVALMENVLAKGKLKVSSNDAMANRYSAIPLVIPSLKSQGFPVRS